MKFMGMWHSDEYDPRHTDAGSRPAGVNTGNSERSIRQYTLRVGTFAMSRSPDRQPPLSALRYQPTLCLVINSPIETPPRRRCPEGLGEAHA